jgi:hypothetical protein
MISQDELSRQHHAQSSNGDLLSPLLRSDSASSSMSTSSSEQEAHIMHDLAVSEAQWRLKLAVKPDEIMWYNLQYSHADQAKWSLLSMTTVCLTMTLPTQLHTRTHTHTHTFLCNV